jgi:hypothetical protein
MEACVAWAGAALAASLTLVLTVLGVDLRPGV